VRNVSVGTLLTKVPTEYSVRGPGVTSYACENVLKIRSCLRGLQCRDSAGLRGAR
jgi:hypothetical protein